MEELFENDIKKENNGSNFLKNLLSFIILTLLISIFAVFLTYNILDIKKESAIEEDFIAPELKLIPSSKYIKNKSKSDNISLLSDEIEITKDILLEKNKLKLIEEEKKIKLESELANKKLEIERIKMDKEIKMLELEVKFRGEELKKLNNDDFTPGGGEGYSVEDKSSSNGEGASIDEESSLGDGASIDDVSEEGNVIKNDNIYSQGEELKAKNNLYIEGEGTADEADLQVFVTEDFPDNRDISPVERKKIYQQGEPIQVNEYKPEVSSEDVSDLF